MKAFISFLPILPLTFLSGSFGSSTIQNRRLENKQIEAAGLTVKILGQSGKMNLMSNNSKVQITMDALKEYDMDGKVVGNTGSSAKHSINNFAQVDFTFGAEETVTLFDTAAVNETTINETSARGLQLTFSSTLDTGSKLIVVSNIVKEAGLAGDAGGNWTLDAGDFKFNINLEDWQWCTADTCKGGVGKYVQIDIEIKGNSTQAQEVEGEESTFELGADTKLELANTYVTSDGTVRTMPDGYPMMTQQGGKTAFAFRFEKFMVDEDKAQNIKYDPILRFPNQDGSTSPPLTTSSASGVNLALSSMLAVSGLIAYLQVF
mmetsp:Transcript_30397/g.40591  ORF Transcript_30397/g.40591 Transcript_30397/m.40591 type:complete len:319 (-) Transcript_30397:9-965(-)